MGLLTFRDARYLTNFTGINFPKWHVKYNFTSINIRELPKNSLNHEGSHPQNFLPFKVCKYKTIRKVSKLRCTEIHPKKMSWDWNFCWYQQIFIESVKNINITYQFKNFPTKYTLKYNFWEDFTLATKCSYGKVISWFTLDGVKQSLNLYTNTYLCTYTHMHIVNLTFTKILI